MVRASSNTAWFASDISGLGVQLPAALTHNPDAVFIEFAINDASTDVKITPAESKQNLQTMIDRINAWAATKDKSVDIIIQTMSNDPLSGLRPDLASYEQGYRDVAKANGLLLIDHYPTWVNLYSNDPTTWHEYVPDPRSSRNAGDGQNHYSRDTKGVEWASTRAVSGHLADHRPDRTCRPCLAQTRIETAPNVPARGNGEHGADDAGRTMLDALAKTRSEQSPIAKQSAEMIRGSSWS